MFRTSTYCGIGACVEVAFKSSDECAIGACVEVAASNPECDEILVRDGKNPGGSVLTFTRDEWGAFLKGAKKGEFDLPG